MGSSNALIEAKLLVYTHHQAALGCRSKQIEGL